MDQIFEYEDLANFDIKGYVRKLSECRVNLFKPHTLGFLGGHAYWPSRFAPMHPALKGRDFFGELVEECAKHTIEVIPYLVFRDLTPEMTEAHPDYCARLEDGSVPYSDGNNDIAYFWKRRFFVCSNSPGHQKYAENIIHELLDRYPGVQHMNTDVEWHAVGICYCGACREKYRRETGRELPKGGFNVDVKSPDYIEYAGWQAKCVDEYAAVISNAIHQKRPHARSILGLSETLRYGHADAQFYNKAADAYSVEGTPLYLDGERFTPISQGHDEARYAMTFGKPIFNVGNLMAREPMGLWIATGVAPGELKVFLAQSIACGFSPNPTCEVDFRNHDPRPMEILKEYYTFLEKQQDQFADLEPLGEVALYWSSRALNIYGGDQKEFRYYRGFRGFFHALVRGQVPFRMISDVHLNQDYLKPFKVLVMPNAAVLNDADAEAIREFVRNGGTLVSSYHTSLFDEKGRQRSDFLLKDILGVQYLGEKEVPRKDIPPFQYNQVGGMYLRTTREHPIFEGYPPDLYLPYDQYVITEITGEAEVPARTAPPVAPYRPAFEPLPVNDHTAKVRTMVEETNHPAVVVHPVGKGRSVYLPGRVGFSYAQYGHPELARMIVNCARAGVPRFSVETDAPPSVEVYLHRQKTAGRLMINLVNYSGEPQRPYDHIVPVHQVCLSIDETLLPTPGPARLLWSGKTVPVEKHRDRYVLTVDTIDVLESVVL
jgi:hypothetical protein